MHYKLRDTENIDLEGKKLDRIYDGIPKEKRHRLLRALFRMYGCNLIFYMFIGLFYVVCQYSASFLIYFTTNTLIEAVKKKENLTYQMIAFLASMIILSRVFIAILNNQLQFNLNLLGFRVILINDIFGDD
jgi:hypothetical protein